jgi:hypothetical protein
MGFGNPTDVVGRDFEIQWLHGNPNDVLGWAYHELNFENQS